MIGILRNKYLPFVFAIPLFFCCYQYNGIEIDAILYVSQYVNSIDSSRFLFDPAFAFGNQDSLSAFSIVSKIFLEIWGVDKGAFVFTFLMQFFWITAMFFLVKNILKVTKNRFWFLPIICFVIIVFANEMPFSRIMFFKYVECYFCSRTLSMALGITGLAFALINKKCLSLILILLGMAIHPLTAGWCVPFWFLYFFPKVKIPLAVFSLLLPFSFLVHQGVFDFYPDDWLSRPLEYAPTYLKLGRFFVLIAFWSIVVKRLSKDEKVRKIARILLFILAVALYWYLWGGVGEHVFLYQVQTWRAIWIPSILFAPVYVILVKDFIKRFKRKKILTTYDCALLLIGVNMLSPMNTFVLSFGAILMFFMKPVCINIKYVVAFFIVLWLAFLVAQQYQIMVIQGLNPALGFDYYLLNHFKRTMLFCQMPFVACILFYFVRERIFIAMLPLIVYCVASQFVLLPFISFYLGFISCKNKVKYWLGFAVCLFVAIGEGISDTALRSATIFEAFPSRIVWIVFFLLLAFVCLYFAKRIRFVLALLFLSAACAYAFYHYDIRSEIRRQNEKALDDYVEQSIFPSVRDRNRILFYVDGFWNDEPEIRFLTGSYFSLSNIVGEIFYKGQHQEVVRRDKLLFAKGGLDTMMVHERHNAILKKLSYPDTLIDRTSFLCSKNEISHLVTHYADFPFVKEDSTVLFDGKKVYLYGCN